MHILVVPSGYPTKISPNRGIFYKNQVESLSKSGYKITVAFPEIWSLKDLGKYGPETRYSGQIEDGIMTYRLKGYNFLPLIPYSTELTFYFRLKELYKKIVEECGKPDIIHAHCTLWAGYAAMKISENENIPLVITEHSSAIGRNLLKPYQKKLVKDTLKHADEVIAVSPRLRKELGEYMSMDRIHVIPNGVNTDSFYIPSVNLSDSKRKVRFLSIGNLNKNKGMDSLIHAFAQSFRNENVELFIGGKGPEEQELKRLARQLEVNEQVHFLGELTRAQVVKEIVKSDIFVLASRYETFGVVFIEALACGRPIIATKCGGPEMIVDNNNGILVPVDNIDSLSSAMVRMRNNYKDYNAEQIRQNCITRFSENAVVNQLKKIYSKVESGCYT